MDYLIGEKIFSFVTAAERDPDFAAELPAFIAEIRQLFTAEEITPTWTVWSAPRF